MQFECPHCRERVACRDEDAGRIGKCPLCSKTLHVPSGLARDWAGSAEERERKRQQQTARTSALHTRRQSARSYNAAPALGIASLVLGILSLLASCVPCIGLPAGGLGLVIGAVGISLAIMNNTGGLGPAAIGTAVNSVSVLLAFVVLVATVSMNSEDASNDVAETPSATAHARSERRDLPREKGRPAKPDTRQERSRIAARQGARSKPAKPEARSEWYQGGTLHRASLVDWQKASHSNKLATCADFVASMHQDGNLKSSIANSIEYPEGIRPYAKELVDFIDAAAKRDENPTMSDVLYANQTVSGFAAIGMVVMGWTK